MPTSLGVFTTTDCVVLKTVEASLSQVRTPVVLDDILTNTAYRYDIRFINRLARGAPRNACN